MKIKGIIAIKEVKEDLNNGETLGNNVYPTIAFRIAPI